MMMLDTQVAVLSRLAKVLAGTLADLSKEVPATREDLQEILNELAERNLVKAKALGEGEEVIYTITSDGFKELEKTEKKGVSALL
jgi:DNA-binding PadR family transcriptional regulator